MAAGILEHDAGVIWGDTWHKNPRYITQDRPLTITQVLEVFNWDIDKVPLFFQDHRPGARRTTFPVKAWALLRRDTRHVLVHHVGEGYVAESNRLMANFLNENLLAVFPDLVIEGAGTLWNNQTAFINLRTKEFQIKGDKSPSYSRMMYANPLGSGAYRACVHNVRVVCNNTLRAAESEGVANQSLRKWAHVGNVTKKVDEYCQEIAGTLMGLKAQEELLNHLAGLPMTDVEVEKVLAFTFPVLKTDGERKREIIDARRAAVRNQFNSDQGLDLATAHSRYGLLNAITFVIDHERTRQDPARFHWDTVTGGRADLKTEVLDFLSTPYLVAA